MLTNETNGVGVARVYLRAGARREYHTAPPQIALAKSQLASDVVHLRALYDRLRHTQLIIRAAAAAYIESRWLLAQIERNKTP
jgi:hypothetical protein